MAEVNTSSDKNGKRASPKTRKKRSTRVDMTAMVDVAFLLLTFFVLTATINTQKVMEAVKPPICDGPDCNKQIDQEKILTFIMDEDDKLYYYHGAPEEASLENTTYAATGLRQVLQQHLNRYPNRCDLGYKNDSCWDPIFVVKASTKSRYGNLIDLMDELEIVQAPKYVFADMAQADSVLLMPNIAAK
ncbi:MAG: biopolymer transporter ExbD [Bacteroidota bacterium]